MSMHVEEVPYVEVVGVVIRLRVVVFVVELLLKV